VEGSPALEAIVLFAHRAVELVGVVLVFIIHECELAVSRGTPRYVLLCLHALFEAVPCIQLILLLCHQHSHILPLVHLLFALFNGTQNGILAVLDLALQILLDALKVVHMAAMREGEGILLLYVHEADFAVGYLELDGFLLLLEEFKLLDVGLCSLYFSPIEG